MKKLLLLILVLILPIVVAYSDQTEYLNDVAFINSSKGMIAQEPYIIDSNTEATLMFENRANISSFIACIRLPDGLSIDKVNITKAKKKRWWWFDQDLREVYRINDKIKCIKSFDNENNIEISLNLRYDGEGMIKYDVFAYPAAYGYTLQGIQEAINNDHIIILDPYLIGDVISTANGVLYIPFNNNLTTYSMVNVGGNITYDENVDSEDNTTNWLDPTNAYDGNYDTYASVSIPLTVEYIYLNYTKPDNVFAAKWTVKDDCDFVNLTLLSSCYDYDSTQLILRVEGGRNAVNNNVSWECFNGSWNSLRECNVDDKVWEESIFWNYTNYSYKANKIPAVYYIENTSQADSSVNYSVNMIDEINTSINLSGYDYVNASTEDNIFNSTNPMTWTYGGFFLVDTDIKGLGISSWDNDTVTDKYHAFKLYVDANQNWQGIIRTNNVEYAVKCLNVTCSVNTWCHIMHTVDKYNLVEKLYINGTYCNSTVIANADYTDNGTVYIGRERNYGATDTPFYGLVDEILIFNSVLSDDEILELARGYYNSINYSFYDIQTGALINETISVEIFNEDNTYIATRNATNGNLFVSGIPSGDITTTAYSDSYSTTVIQTSIDTDNTNYDVDVFMANKTSEDIGKLYIYVFNQNYYAIKNANVKLQQFFASEGEFKEIQQCYTNSNGECIFDIVLGEGRYIVTAQATINNITAYTQSSTNGNFFPVDNTELELYLNFEQIFQVPDDYGLIVTAYNTSLVGNTSYLYATFSDVYNNNHTVCLGYYYNDGFNKILAAEDCTNASSGTVSYGSSYALNRSYSWTAEIYTKVDGNRFKTYELFIYPKIKSFSTQFAIYLNPLIIVIMAVLLGFSIQLKNILIFPVGMIPVTLLYAFLKPTVFTPAVAAGIIMLCCLLIYHGRKKSDNEAV